MVVAPKASSMEELQTGGFSVMKALGNTASPTVGKSQGVANIPKTSPIIDITGSGAQTAGGGFCDLFATSGKSVDAVRKATSTLDTETAPRLVGLQKELKQAEEVDNPAKHFEEMAARRKWVLRVLSATRLAKEAAAKTEKKAEEELEKAMTEAKKKAWMETMLRRLKKWEILGEEAAAKAEKKAAAKAEKKAEEEVEKAKAEAKAKAAKKKALEEAMELAEAAAKEAARLEAAKAAEEAAKLETEKAAKEAARTKALKEAEAAHLVKLKAAEEASRLEAEKVAAEAARKAKEEAERLEAEKNAEAQTLAVKAKIELSAALMVSAKAKEAQEAARVPKDADIPNKVIGTDGKGQVVLLRHTLGKRGSLGSQEKPPAKRSSMFLEEAQFFNIDELKRQQLEREAAEQKKLATADPRRQPKPSAVGEPSNLSKGVTEQVPPGEFVPEAASTAAARLSVEDALRRGPNSEEFGRVLTDNERLWRRVRTMEKKINRMSRDIKIILERQPLPPPMPKPAAATTSTMTGVERDGVRLHALIAQHNRLSSQIAVTVSQMSDIIAGENK